MIYYASRTLNETQLNYITTEKEFLAVVFVLEKFRHTYLGLKQRFSLFIPSSGI